MPEIKPPDDANSFALMSLDDTTKLLFRSLPLINGGAAVAILAFAGNVLSRPVKGAAINPAVLAAPLVYFSFGVGCAVAALAVGYFSGNYGYMIISAYKAQEEAPKWSLRLWRVLFHVTVIFTLTSLPLFFIGIWASHNAVPSFVR